MSSGAVRPGFALVVALWVLVGGAALAIVGATTAREGLQATRNRVNYERAYWLADGCAERTQYAITRALWPEGFTPATVNRAWSTLDAVVDPQFESSLGCAVSLEPSGLRLDVNLATSDQLIRLASTLGLSASSSDSIVDAILDWRDADDEPRSFGAERAWYHAHDVGDPRNGRLVVSSELQEIRGVGNVPGLLAVLGVDSVPVLWTRAPLAVLAALPGMTPEALAVFEAHRSEITDFSTLAAFPELSSAARDTLARNAAALIQWTSATPEWWTITVRAASGQPAVTCTLQLRVGLGDRRLIVTRRVVDP